MAKPALYRGDIIKAEGSPREYRILAMVTENGHNIITAVDKNGDREYFWDTEVTLVRKMPKRGDVMRVAASANSGQDVGGGFAPGTEVVVVGVNPNGAICSARLDRDGQPHGKALWHMNEHLEPVEGSGSDGEGGSGESEGDDTQDDKKGSQKPSEGGKGEDGQDGDDVDLIGELLSLAARLEEDALGEPIPNSLTDRLSKAARAAVHLASCLEALTNSEV